MLTVVIINYNGKEMIEACFAALGNQTFRDFKIIFLDNASADDSIKIAEEKKHLLDNASTDENHKNLLSNLSFEIFKNPVNTGYAGAAQQAVLLCKTKYLMPMNPDIFFEPDYLQILIEKAENDATIASIIGKLKQYDWKNKQKTNVIDSTGLQILKNRRIIDRGQAEEDRGQYDKEEEVFGATGAAPLYRMSALKEIAIDGQTFDTDFFMYKEDCDVAWRLRLFGWKALYVPGAVAYHVRGTGIAKRKSFLEIARERKHLSRFQRHYSLINQHLMQIKNDQWSNMLKNAPSIIAREVAQLGFTLLREPFLIKSWIELVKKLPKTLRARRAILKRKKVTPKEMQKWFN